VASMTLRQAQGVLPPLLSATLLPSAPLPQLQCCWLSGVVHVTSGPTVIDSSWFHEPAVQFGGIMQRGIMQRATGQPGPAGLVGPCHQCMPGCLLPYSSGSLASCKILHDSTNSSHAVSLGMAGSTWLRLWRLAGACQDTAVVLSAAMAALHEASGIMTGACQAALERAPWRQHAPALCSYAVTTPLPRRYGVPKDVIDTFPTEIYNPPSTAAATATIQSSRDTSNTPDQQATPAAADKPGALLPGSGVELANMHRQASAPLVDQDSQASTAGDAGNRPRDGASGSAGLGRAGSGGLETLFGGALRRVGRALSGVAPAAVPDR
jgi:hypothetical protein